MALPEVGASILEISHRSGTFKNILQQTKQDLTTLLAIPDNYEVLFLQGGSRLQFSMIPMNLLSESAESADYIITGSWGKNAATEASKVGNLRVVWDGSDHNYDRLPQLEQLDLDPRAAYLYYVSNETIQGVQFAEEPPAGEVPLVCDASSDFLHRPLEISKYGLIYACAQKNAGPAGVTIVVIRKDLLQRSSDALPGYLNYQTHAEQDSLWNTAPTFSIYVVGLVAKWLRNEIGGWEKMHEINRQKANMLYQVIDDSNGFYSGHAQPAARSLMNVTFRLPNDDLNELFLHQAEARNLHALAGHRSVGGIRASIYNAMPVAGVEQLRDFMLDFQKGQK